jgi:serine protease Do
MRTTLLASSFVLALLALLSASAGPVAPAAQRPDAGARQASQPPLAIPPATPPATTPPASPRANRRQRHPANPVRRRPATVSAARADLLQIRMLLRNGRSQSSVGSGFLVGTGNLV